MMRYSLRTLLLLFAVIGPVCLALRAPTALWSWTIFMITFLALLSSVLVIVFRKGQTRASAIGFLVFGGTFLVLNLLTNGGRLAAVRGTNPFSAMAVALYEQVHQGQAQASPTHFIAFLEIVHSSSALVLGLVGGLLAQMLYVEPKAELSKGRDKETK